MMSLEQIILLIVTLLLVVLIFYVSGALVSRDWSVTAGYVVRLLALSVLAVMVIPVFREAADLFKLEELGLLLAFVILIVAVRFLLVEQLPTADDWLTSIFISLVGVVLIYLIDKAGEVLFDIKLLSVF
jgi:hypothetical protein